MFKPLPKIRNMTILRFAQSFSGQSTCNGQNSLAICNPQTSGVSLFQLGARNSTMYFFTPNFYATLNVGGDLNQFIFTPSFSVNPDNYVPSRTYHNPSPNIGLSIGFDF